VKIGAHGGVHRFTIGQRKGLGIAAPQPLYVLKLDSATGTVVVGAREALEQTRLTASGVNWICTEAPSDWLRVAGQIRHRHAAAPGRVRALADGRAELEFDSSQPAITPGQAVVFYDGDVVVGGGWID
jgi:tRNA-specific 2-thiouridylase